MMRILAASLAAATLLAASVVAQTTWIVDAGGGGDFLSIETACATAASGDTVVIRFGIYTFGVGDSEIVIEGKSLTVVGDGPTRPKTVSFTIRDLAPDQGVTLRGIEVPHAGFPPQAAVRCENAQGPVLIEDCVLEGNTEGFFIGELADGFAGVEARQCAGVVVVRSELRGGHGAVVTGSIGQPHDESAGGPGLHAIDSRVSLYDCIAMGGGGGWGDTDEGERGGDGVRAEGSEVVLARVYAEGGLGGPGCTVAGPVFCQGGNGLRLEGDCSVFQQECSLVAGAGGDLVGGAGAGLPGDEQVVTPSDTAVSWPGTTRELVVGSPVRENAVTTIRYEGEPGDTFGLFFAYAPGYLPLYGKQGVFALGVPFVGPTLVWTVTAPDGVFDVPFTAWDLAPFGLEAASVFGQCFVQPAGSATVLSSPTALTILDDSL